MKVSPRGETVLLECAQSQGRARFTVAHRGPPVPAERKKDFFPRQFSVDSQGGPIVGPTFFRMASEALKGDLRVEDRPGGGSVFILELPELPAAAPAKG